MTASRDTHTHRSLVIQTADDLSLHVLDWGGAEKPVCILIHGSGDGAYIWHDVVNHLQLTHRVLAVDLRGHGESQWDSRRRYSLRDHTSDVLYMLDALGIDCPILVGHSLGGAISLRLALDYPARVRAMALIDYAPDLDRAASLHARNAFLAQFRTYATISEYVDWLSESRPMVAMPILQRLALAALRLRDEGGHVLRCDPAVAGSDADLSDHAELSGHLGQITCPALIVRGQASAMLSLRKAQELSHRIRRARLVSIASAGHAVMTDNPAVLGRTLAQFTRLVSGEARSAGVAARQQ